MKLSKPRQIDFLYASIISLVALFGGLGLFYLEPKEDRSSYKYEICIANHECVYADDWVNSTNRNCIVMDTTESVQLACGSYIIRDLNL